MKSKNTLPTHRQLLIESMELLFSGKKAKAKRTLKKAEMAIDKFYQK